MISIIQQKIKERCFDVERKEFGDKSNFPVIAILLKQPLKGEFHNRATEQIKILSCVLSEMYLLQPGQSLRL